MTERQKSMIELRALEAALDDGDLFYEVPGVSEEEAYDYIKNKIIKLCEELGIVCIYK